MKDPDALPALLRCPAFARADRVHLSSFRPRSAVPRVLSELVKARPELVHLDLLDVPCPFEPVADLPRLIGLGMRLEHPVRAELSVTQLCIRVLTPDDFAQWLDVETPHLERLEIRRVPVLDWDSESLQPAVVKALLDRPFRTLALDRALYYAHRGVFERHSAGRIAVVPPRPVWDPMLRREAPQRWSLLA